MGKALRQEHLNFFTTRMNTIESLLVYQSQTRMNTCSRSHER